VVLDLYSRRVVGWSVQANVTAQLVADAPLMAAWRRGRPSELTHHSDQGSQYSSEQFQDLLKAQPRWRSFAYRMSSEGCGDWRLSGSCAGLRFACTEVGFGGGLVCAAEMEAKRHARLARH
jgi:hypothetical protein